MDIAVNTHWSLMQMLPISSSCLSVAFGLDSDEPPQQSFSFEKQEINGRFSAENHLLHLDFSNANNLKFWKKLENTAKKKDY